MKLRVVKLFAFACCVISILVAQHLAAFNAPVKAQKTSPIEQVSRGTDALVGLDTAIQKRFHDVIGFGMARIATEKRFVPETKEEREPVKSLKKAKLRVGLYLAGRMILEPKPAQSRWGQYGISRTISNPIFIGSNTKLSDLPQRLDLWEHTQKALLAFSEGGELYEFTMGEWNVRARPVRAIDQSCLQCHREDYRIVYLSGQAITFESKGNNGLKIGDPIGVLLYAFSQLP